MGKLWHIPTLQYPDDANDPSVPKEAREELKRRIRQAHQDVCRAAMIDWYERLDEWLRAVDEAEKEAA